MSTVVCFTFVSVQPIFSQAKNSASPPAVVESEQIGRLNERVAAQDQQLAAQQAQINALQSGLAEQKALIDRLLHEGQNVATENHYIRLPGVIVQEAAAEVPKLR